MKAVKTLPPSIARASTLNSSPLITPTMMAFGDPKISPSSRVRISAGTWRPGSVSQRSAARRGGVKALRVAGMSDSPSVKG